MIIDIIGVAGFTIMGLVLPEIAVSVGGVNKEVPFGQNFWCSIGAALISSYFIFGGSI